MTVSFSLATAANTIYLYAAQILTSLVASGHQSGLFAASFRVFIVIATVPGILVGSAFPVIARAARDDRARLGYALQRTFEVSLILGVAALLGAVGGADFIIKVVAGPKYAGAAAALRIEGLALLASFLLAGWGFALLALHRHVQLLLANIVALTISAVLTIELAKTHGAQGAAIASACGESALAALYLVFLLRSERALRLELGVAAKVALAAAPALAIALLAGLPAVVQPLLSLAVFGVLLILLRAIPDELRDLIPGPLRRRSR
jgi:O-antigen/teichoic acid export membrane protein